MDAAKPLCPRDRADLVQAIGDAAARRLQLDIQGGGSKAGIGAERRDATPLDLTAFTGIIDYDPPELVLTVGAATPLAEIEELVASEGQMLAFEPFDHSPLFGRAAGAATIGGVVAAGVAGSRRLSRGGVRDHLLGFEAVSGRGEAFVAGAKVVKNVTGYDLPKLLCGSWGRLAALTQVTLKVLPAPRARMTVVLRGLEPLVAQAAMALALGSAAEVSAAAHLPGTGPATALTLLRVEGIAPSVDARVAMLQASLTGFGTPRTLDESQAVQAWAEIRELTPLGDAPLWRVNVAPSAGPAIVEALAPRGAGWLLDWAGGLVWVGFSGDPQIVRDAATRAGGHATLVRAPAGLRARVPTLHPPARGVAALEARIRHAFDPHGVFETGRFGDMRDAD